jgi:hypothetical protein
MSDIELGDISLSDLQADPETGPLVDTTASRSPLAISPLSRSM